MRSGRVASFEAAHLSEIAGAGDRLSHLGLHETGDERFEVSEDPQPGDRFEPRKWLYRGYAYEQDRQRSAAGDAGHGLPSVRASCGKVWKRRELPSGLATDGVS